MTNRTVFTGAATAIITPLTPDGIDFERYGALIDWQIAQGIDAIVAVGTTGEGSTLSDEEHRAAIKYCVERVNGRVPVIAGTGSNDTAYSVDLSRYAASVGADAMLLVTPYYNKATQKGLVKFFTDIADASTVPPSSSAWSAWQAVCPSSPAPAPTTPPTRWIFPATPPPWVLTPCCW